MADNQQAAAPDTTRNILVNVVLDRSGSMASNQLGTISGYNEFLQGLKLEKETNYQVTLIQFDAHQGPELTVSYTEKPLAEVVDLNPETYQPRGGTPLYDAIGECIRRVDAKDRGVITVIITDGMENASREFSMKQVKALISAKEALGWKFVFLGANIDSMEVGGSLGMSAGATANYTAGMEQNMFANVAQVANRYASTTRSAGMRVAATMCAFMPEERSSMMGGDQATPVTFHTASTAPRKPGTKWTVQGNVSGSR